MDQHGAAADLNAEDALRLVAVDLPFIKATPHTEGDRRLLFLEPSNQNVDQQDDQIIVKALLGSRDFYIAHGNVDIEHLTFLGHHMGVANPHLWEIGRPIEVFPGPSGQNLLMKAEIYHGPGDHLEKANWFWKTQVEQSPPQRWYPSVLGAAKEKRRFYDPATRRHRNVITKAVWQNVGLAKRPQNLSVLPVATAGFQALGYHDFAKAVAYALAQPECVCADGTTGAACCGITKAITASPMGTDVASYTGGAALTRQSIQGGVAHPYTQAVKSLVNGACEHAQDRAPTRVSLTAHFQHCGGMDEMEARRAAARLLAQLKQRMTLRRAA